MSQIDFDKLEETIDEFEQTITALDKIETISRQNEEIADHIKMLCLKLDGSTEKVVKELTRFLTTVQTFDEDFEQASKKLLSIKGSIEESNLRTYTEIKEGILAVRGLTEACIAEISRSKAEVNIAIGEQNNFLSTSIEKSKLSLLAKNDETKKVLTNVITEQNKALSTTLDKLKEQNNTIHASIRQASSEISSQLAAKERAIADKLRLEIGKNQEALKQLEDKLEHKLELLTSQIGQWKDETTKHNNQSQKLMLICAIASCAATVLSVIGLLI